MSSASEEEEEDDAYYDRPTAAVGTGTKTRPAAWTDAWLTSEEHCLLASVFTGR